MLTSGNSVSLLADACEFEIEIEASADYYSRIDPADSSWLSVIGSPKNANLFCALENISSDAREGHIFFSSAGAVTRVLSVQQAGSTQTRHIIIEKSEYSVGAEGGMVEILVDSYPEASATVDADWISLYSHEADKYTFAVCPMESELFREAHVLFSCVGCQDVSVTVSQHKEIARKSLVLRFTGDWCGYCPYMSYTIHKAQDLYPEGIVDISVYCNSSARLSCESADRLVEFFGVSGYPTAVMDWRAIVNHENGKDTPGKFPDVYLESLECYPAMSALNLEMSQNGSEIYVDVNLISLLDDSDAKILVYVIEDGIISPQAYYGNPALFPQTDFSHYSHNNVLKACLTLPSGDAVVLSSGINNFKFNYDLPSDANAEKIGFMVAVLRKNQEDQVSEVKGVKYIETGYYVDNVSIIKYLQ